MQCHRTVETVISITNQILYAETFGTCIEEIMNLGNGIIIRT